MLWQREDTSNFRPFYPSSAHRVPGSNDFSNLGLLHTELIQALATLHCLCPSVRGRHNPSVGISQVEADSSLSGKGQVHMRRLFGVLALAVIALLGSSLAKSHGASVIGMPDGRNVLEFVGQVNNTPTTSQQFGYLSNIEGLSSIFSSSTPQNESTALFTFVTNATTDRVISDGPLRIINRTGTNHDLFQQHSIEFQRSCLLQPGHTHTGVNLSAAGHIEHDDQCIRDCTYEYHHDDRSIHAERAALSAWVQGKVISNGVFRPVECAWFGPERLVFRLRRRRRISGSGTGMTGTDSSLARISHNK